MNDRRPHGERMRAAAAGMLAAGGASFTADGTTWCPMCGTLTGMGLWGMLAASLFLVLTGVAILLVWAALRAGRRTARPPDDPCEILRTRYAKGELTRDEFERMKHDLRC